MVKEAAQIMKALLEAQSPRLTNIAEKMPGQKSESNYKVIQRFLNKVDMKQTLWRLYQEDAEFIIGDPTEIERYKEPKTSYVGTLSDGKTAGYWLMVLSTPFRGRSLPFSFVVHSSRTIGDQCTSRNQEHFRCFEEVKRLLGNRPLVLDREFSYEDLMQVLEMEQIQFVIRLNLGDQHKHHAWPYAVEAKYAESPADRLRALGLALYLDRHSAHIAHFSKEERDKALKWLEPDNPFILSLKEKWNKAL